MWLNPVTPLELRTVMSSIPEWFRLAVRNGVEVAELVHAQVHQHIAECPRSGLSRKEAKRLPCFCVYENALHARAPECHSNTERCFGELRGTDSECSADGCSGDDLCNA